MIKKSVIKNTALVLSIIYILSLATVISGATSIGTTIYESTINIANNASYTNLVAWHPEYLREEANVITYTPNQSGVRPIIAYGSKIYGRSNIKDVIDYATNTENQYIMGGINGDFYSLQTGVPLGMVVHNGKLISSDDSFPALGFKSDGSCIIGNPELTISMKVNNKTIPINYFNKYRTQYGVYLFSEDFSSESRTSKLGTHIVLKIVKGKIGIGQSVETKVIDIMEDAGNIAMQEGTLLLSVDNNGPLDKIKDIMLDQSVLITFKASSDQWNSVVEAVGGGAYLVKDSAAVPCSDNSIAGVNPRTAIGVKANGEVVMAQIDGRQSNHSLGATFSELSEFMLQQGCITALNLDGGGSSTTTVRMPGETALSVVNNPSDGALRANANFILLTNTASRTNKLKKIQIYPYNINILPNTKIELSAKGMDAGYYSVSMPSSSGITYSIDDKEKGSVQKSNNIWTFTSLDTTGSTRIQAKEGTATGETTVNIVSGIDDMFVYDKGTSNVLESVDLAAGETQSFDISAHLNTQKVYAQPSSFKWEVLDEGLGTFSEPGVFVAAKTKGISGQIKVSYGELSKIINITVGRDTQVIYDFEKATGSFNTTKSGLEPKVSINSIKEYVRYGVGSLAFEYKEDTDVATSTTMQRELYASLETVSPKTIGGSPKYINLWVYGDNSGNEIYTTIIDSKNNEIKILYSSKLDFNGWKLVSARIDSQNLPIKLKTPFGIKVTTQNKAGKVYIDQFSTTYDAKLNDITGPSIEFSSLDKWDKKRDTLDITAAITDDSSAAVSKGNISFKVDGRSVDFNYLQNEGRFRASLINNFDPGFHKFAITATDNVGNITYKFITVDFPENSDNLIFADTKDHWANKHIDYIYNEAIAQGSIDEKSGERYFFPDNDVTRAEFAIMLCRYLRLDTSLYLKTELPFADKSNIKDWALPHIKALYANEIMNGKPSADGKLVFDPSAKLTRAEIITAIGKLFKKGYKEAEINFTDSSDIGTWAYPYVKMLVGMGVVNGYSDGTLLPGSSVKRSEVAKIFYTIY